MQHGTTEENNENSLLEDILKKKNKYTEIGKFIYLLSLTVIII